MLKVKKLIAIVLTVTILSTLCVFVNVGAEATTKTITLLDLNFDDQKVVEKTATDGDAGFQIDPVGGGTATTTQISGSDYGLTSTADSWWLLMKLPRLVTTGKLTFEYSFVNSNNEYNYAFASPSLPTDETVNGGYTIKFAASTQTEPGTGSTVMYGFNDAMNSIWANGATLGQKTAVEGKNRVKVEIDYNTNTLTTFLNNGQVRKRNMTTESKTLANGVGAFGIRDPRSSVFDDISIKWEYPTQVVYFDNGFNFTSIDNGVNSAATMYTGVTGAKDERIGTWKAADREGNQGLDFTGFTNGFYVVGLPKAISSDVVSYSFDFVSRGGTNPSNVGVSIDQTTAAWNNEIDKYGAYIKDGVFYPPTDTMSSTMNTAEAVTLDKTKKYTMVQSFNFETKTVTTILTEEGTAAAKFKETMKMPSDMAFASLKFVLNDGISFFDNVKVVGETSLLADVQILRGGSEIAKDAIAAGDDITLKINLNRILADDAAVLLGGLYVNDVMVDGGTANVVWVYDEGTAQVDLKVPEAYTGKLELKGFLWNSLGDLKPLTESF